MKRSNIRSRAGQDVPANTDPAQAPSLQGKESLNDGTGSLQRFIAVEFKVVSLREMPEDAPLVDNPDTAAQAWRQHISTAPWYQPEKECVCLLLLDSRRRLLGWHLASIGTLDSVVVHPRDIFRTAFVANAHSVIIAHNHPSGDPSPSSGDLKFTREVEEASRLLKVEVADHIIVGRATEKMPRDYVSLRELGCMTNSRPVLDTATQRRRRPEWRMARELDKLGKRIRQAAGLLALLDKPGAARGAVEWEDRKHATVVDGGTSDLRRAVTSELRDSEDGLRRVWSVMRERLDALPPLVEGRQA